MYLTEKQLNILEFVQEWRDQRGVSPTLEEMATHFGVTKITIYEHLNQLEKKGAIRRAKFRARSIEILTPVPKKKKKKYALPLVGNLRADSAPDRPESNAEAKDTLDLEEVFPRDRTCYALRVRGDSMVDDHIQDGDYVIVENRGSASNGETVVAVLENGETILKRYFREKGRIRLQPANGSTTPIYARKVEIRGVVVGVVRRFLN